MKLKSKIAGILVVVLCLANCSPDTVQKSKTSALKRLHEAEIGLNAGFDLVEDFRTNNLISQEKEIEALRLISQLNAKIRKVNSIVRKIDAQKVVAEDSTDVEAAVKELSGIATDLQRSGLLGIKSPTSELTFDALVVTINLAVADGQALINAIKAVK